MFGRVMLKCFFGYDKVDTVIKGSLLTNSYLFVGQCRQTYLFSPNYCLREVCLQLEFDPINKKVQIGYSHL